MAPTSALKALQSSWRQRRRGSRGLLVRFIAQRGASSCLFQTLDVEEVDASTAASTHHQEFTQMHASTEKSESDHLSSAISLLYNEIALSLAADDVSATIKLRETEQMAGKCASLDLHHIIGSKPRSVEAVAFKNLMISSSLILYRLFLLKISSMIVRRVAEGGSSRWSLLVELLSTWTKALLTSSSFNVSLLKLKLTARASFIVGVFTKEAYFCIFRWIFCATLKRTLLFKIVFSHSASNFSKIGSIRLSMTYFAAE